MIQQPIFSSQNALHLISRSDKYRSRSRETDNKKPSVFLQKIYDILTNPLFSDIISFMDDGITFVLKNTDEFCREVLPSFTRQLNLYGFKKIRNTDNNYEFYHKYFRKNDKNLMLKIKRKTGQKIEDQIKKVKRREENQKFNRKISSLTNEVQSTKIDLSELEKSCQKCAEGQSLLKASVSQIKAEIFQCQIQRNLHNQLYQQILSILLQKICLSQYENQIPKSYYHKSNMDSEFKKSEQLNETTENNQEIKSQKFIHKENYQQHINFLFNVNQRFV